jgi:hypothetical protein
MSAPIRIKGRFVSGHRHSVLEDEIRIRAPLQRCRRPRRTRPGFSRCCVGGGDKSRSRTGRCGSRILTRPLARMNTLEVLVKCALQRLLILLAIRTMARRGHAEFLRSGTSGAFRFPGISPSHFVTWMNGLFMPQVSRRPPGAGSNRRQFALSLSSLPSGYSNVLQSRRFFHRLTP